MPNPIPVQTAAEVAEETKRRRERIMGYISQEPPLPMSTMTQMEGITDRTIRTIIKELEVEHGFEYLSQGFRKTKNTVPYGLTPATLRLRQMLGDQLFLLRNRGHDSTAQGRNNVAPQLGLNIREQIRAEQRPFNHDWKLSQIERLARELGRDPRELLMSCLTR